MSKNAQYPEADVRQSTFALIGDIASRAVEALYPILNQLVPLLVQAVNPKPRLSQVSAESNCVWCLGELAASLGISSCIMVCSSAMFC